ncbi:MAG TPA: KTSC domain-containing protein [Parafilimonas sp.]|nr:KTSC domain-containing protein [Parafilimonas sp.]
MKKLRHTNAIYLDSTALKMINYDEDALILEATFANDEIYWYLNVPVNIWTDFLNVIYSGASAGAFINKEIKPFYECIKITD